VNRFAALVEKEAFEAIGLQVGVHEHVAIIVQGDGSSQRATAMTRTRARDVHKLYEIVLDVIDHHRVEAVANVIMDAWRGVLVQIADSNPRRKELGLEEAKQRSDVDIARLRDR